MQVYPVKPTPSSIPRALQDLSQVLPSHRQRSEKDPPCVIYPHRDVWGAVHYSRGWLSLCDLESKSPLQTTEMGTGLISPSVMGPGFTPHC